MNLTPHFTLEELTFSQTAARLGINNEPQDEALRNLHGLAALLEDVRSLAGHPIIITSGYRCPELNGRIGGAPLSSHIEGRAADIVCPPCTPKELAELIVSKDLAFDQLILEFDRWVHISVAINPRREILTALRGDSGTQYKVGLA